MGYICHECLVKISKARNEAREEINRRLDGGEKEEALCVEYENEQHRLLKSQLSDTERYVWLGEAIQFCYLILGCGKIRNAGWTINHSGEWVRVKESQPPAPQSQIDAPKAQNDVLSADNAVKDKTLEDERKNAQKAADELTDIKGKWWYKLFAKKK